MAPPGRRGGKFSKPTRGGGKHFSRDLQPLDKDGNAVGMWRDPAEQDEDSSEEEEDEESSEEESDEDEAAENGNAKLGNTAGSELSREQRKEAARQKKLAAIAKKNKKVAEVGDLPTSDEDEEEEGDEDMPANPNHSSKARAQARIATGPSGETPLPSKKDKSQLSRREREAIEAQAAKERYQKLHAEGKTDEARADLERLKLIRQQREEAAARKKAEQEEREAEKKEREAEIEAREQKLRDAALGGGKKPIKKTKK